MGWPLQIDPCPIREAVAEIRFETKIPPDAVFGVVYNELSNLYGVLEPLPIIQIPEAVRSMDQNLIFQPHYRMRRQNFVTQVGPRVFSVAMMQPYSKWETFLKEIRDVFQKIGSLGFIESVIRVGLRYINIFEIDILSELNLSLTIIDNEITSEEAVIRTVLPKDDFSVSLSVVNKANLIDSIVKMGNISVIDIDVFSEKKSNDFFKEINGNFEKAHSLEKEIFFGLLKPDFLSQLNPVYEGAKKND